MKVLNRYTSQETGSLTETRFSEIADFLKGEVLPEEFDREEAMSFIPGIIDSNSEKYAILLARGTGNALSDCRIEISASADLLRGAYSLLSGQEQDFSGANFASQPGGFSQFSDGLPLRGALCILPGRNPFYRFAESVAASCISGTRTVIRTSSLGISSIMSFWKDLSGRLSGMVLPAVLSREGNTLRKLVASELPEKIIFRGSGSAYREIRKKAGSRDISGTLNGRCHALVWNDADLDYAAKSIVNLSLKGMRDSSMIPSRVIVHDESAEYLSNRIVEEALKLRSGDPADPSTDISSLASAEHVSAFMEAVGDERKNWAEELLSSSVDHNAATPAVFIEAEKSGSLWNSMEYGPFVVIRKVKSTADAMALLKADSSAQRLMVYTSDLNLVQYVSANSGTHIMINVPPHADHRSMLRVDGSFLRLVLSMKKMRETVIWK